MFKVKEPYRLTHGKFASTEKEGNNGVFYLPIVQKILFKERQLGFLQCIASDGLGWEHVSVTPVCNDKQKSKDRCPTWVEMCYVKNNFWGEDDVVIQFHPDKAHYKNQHPYVLHLWRRIGSFYELPDTIMV